VRPHRLHRQGLAARRLGSRGEPDAPDTRPGAPHELPSNVPAIVRLRAHRSPAACRRRAGPRGPPLRVRPLGPSHRRHQRRPSLLLDPSSASSFNVDIATESFIRGGWFGRGPGEGTIKRILPEGHTDFVFAVAAEEFGIVLCLILVALFAFIVIRALGKAMRNEDPFTRFAAAGLAILFGLQSTINMAVNLHLMPAKGMTLPFISYGGSSLVSLAFGMGMLVALTRERPSAQLPGEIVIAGSRV